MPRLTPYREHRPHPGLARYVACYWSFRCRATPPADEEAIVPDACMDFLFDLAAPGQGEVEVVGTMTRPIAVSRERGMDLLGVRFRPGAIGAFMRVPAHELTDGLVGLEAVWGPDARELYDRLRAEPGTAERVAILDGALSARLGAGEPPDPIALAAAGLVESSEGRIRVEDLARKAGLGRRQLERRFLAAVGIAPKVACRVVRFQAALHRLHASDEPSLARVAIEAGYHDQAHLTRDFTALAGMPPGEYRARRREPGDASLQDGTAGGL